jgi:hypothetical protein
VARSDADDRASIVEALAHFDGCIKAAEAGELSPTTPKYSQCTDPPRPPLGPELIAERARLQQLPTYQRTQKAEVEYSIYGPDRSADAQYASLFGKPHPFGDMPLIVLSSSMFDMSPPFGELNYSAWTLLHNQTAAMSRQGERRMVPGSRHNVQIDKPQAVVDAIVEVLEKVRGDK